MGVVTWAKGFAFGLLSVVVLLALLLAAPVWILRHRTPLLAGGGVATGLGAGVAISTLHPMNPFCIVAVCSVPADPTPYFVAAGALVILGLAVSLIAARSLAPAVNSAGTLER